MLFRGTFITRKTSLKKYEYRQGKFDRNILASFRQNNITSGVMGESLLEFGQYFFWAPQYFRAPSHRPPRGFTCVVKNIILWLYSNCTFVASVTETLCNIEATSNLWSINSTSFYWLMSSALMASKLGSIVCMALVQDWIEMLSFIVLWYSKIQREFREEATCKPASPPIMG